MVPISDKTHLSKSEVDTTLNPIQYGGHYGPPIGFSYAASKQCALLNRTEFEPGISLVIVMREIDHTHESETLKHVV